MAKQKGETEGTSDAKSGAKSAPKPLVVQTISIGGPPAVARSTGTAGASVSADVFVRSLGRTPGAAGFLAHARSSHMAPRSISEWREEMAAFLRREVP